MFFQRIFSPEVSSYSYLIGQPESKQCIVIDPVRLIDPILEIIQAQGMELALILETHVHADFISGARELKYHFHNKPKIYCSAMGGQEWIPSYVDQHVKEGDEIRIGSICLKALHTPGHTPEHLVLLGFDLTRSRDNPWFILTGDLLFVGSVGRPDLLGEGHFIPLAKKLYHSLFQRLASYPDFAEIYPGHGAGSNCGKNINSWPTSTLGYERRYNAFLKPLPEEQWIQNLTKEMSTPSLSFQHIKKVNLQGPQIMQESYITPVLLNPKMLSDPQTNAILIDVRPPEDFAQQHMARSINIPMEHSFCSWVGMVVPSQTPLLLIIPESQSIDHIAKLLWLTGYENIIGYMTWESLSALALKWNSFPLLDVEKLASQQEDPNLYVLDVRTPAEWASGHIPDAHHIELAVLPQTMDQIPKESRIAVTCRSGYRASIAASLLKKQGFHKVENIKGGMKAWQQARLPTVGNY